LFDDKGFMKKPAKYELCQELEKKLQPGDYISKKEWTSIPSAWIIDVMATIRGVKTTTLKTFGDLFDEFVNKVVRICGKPARLDIVLDTYLEGSVKDSERLRRLDETPIEINNLQSATLLPVKMSSFWGSSSNKTKLQTELRQVMKDRAGDILPQGNIVLSATGIEGRIQMQPSQSVSGNTVHEVADLNIDAEEADVRIMIHVLHCARSGIKRVVVLANDTDILVLLLYHWHTFQTHGLLELWMRGGSGDTTRYIPVHTLATNLGQATCKILIALHMLTGADTTSKLGTKSAALKAKPEMYLAEFGHDPESINLPLVEEYLVKVLRIPDSAKTMDDARFHAYHHSSKALTELPPTSRMTVAHIYRAFYGTYIQQNCLFGLQANPADFRYACADDGLLLPIENQCLLPDDFPSSCNCGKCATIICPCKAAGVACCSYCRCQACVTPCCKNPHMLLPIPMRM